MYKLNDTQKEQKASFIDAYVNAENAATGSQVDSNANVTHKTISTLEAELYKADTIQVNRHLVYKKITISIHRPHTRPD